MADLREAGRGELTLARHRWTWMAERSDAKEGASDPLDFLEWFEFTFQRADDAEQVAQNRAGVPRQEWTERTLRSILRSVRERTWRDADGTLWRLKLSGWSAAGISTEVGGGGTEEGPEVIFHRVEGGTPVKRSTADLRSLTDVSDHELQALLAGERGGEGP